MDKDVEAGPAFPPSEQESEPEEEKPEEEKPKEEKPKEEKPKEEKTDEEKSEVDKQEAKKLSSAERVASSSLISPRASRSARRVVKWKRTGSCECNCWYLLRVRGIMNVVHMALCVAVVVLLGHACQMRPANDRPSEGFFCKPPEVFLFLTSVAALFNSVLIFVCCLFSKRTDNMLFQTSLEISYYIMYFILFLVASVTLLISIIHWGPDRIFFNSDYASLQTLAIIGLVAACCYGISTLWFFISHQFYTSEIIIEDDQVVDNLIVANGNAEANSKKIVLTH